MFSWLARCELLSDGRDSLCSGIMEKMGMLKTRLSTSEDLIQEAVQALQQISPKVWTNAMLT